MAEDTMLQEAIEALRDGENARAKDLLTRLLKTEQNNPTNWIWMSAAVETAKERIYCLETALKLDPKNATAKRGLVLLGALPPDDSIQPFPIKNQRIWEEELVKEEEEENPKGLKAVSKSPLVRLAGLAVLGIAVCALAYFGLSVRSPQTIARLINTPGPSPTYTTTPTFINVTGQPSPTFVGPTPLWALLPATYTPTPFYVNTPRAPESIDYSRIFKSALAKGDWQAVISNMQQIATLEPKAADPFYYIGEAYLALGNPGEAVKAYQLALVKNPNFGAAYLGRARAKVMINPKEESILDDINQAIQLDPNWGEPYLERADYELVNGDPEAALADAKKAERMMPDSPLPYLYKAQAELALDQNAQALVDAKQANQLDLTLLSSYLTLAKAYIANGQQTDAIDALETYTTYEPKDVDALVTLAEAYNLAGRYQDVINLMNKALLMDTRDPEGYYQRGFAYLKLEDGKLAEKDLLLSVYYRPDSFKAQIALIQAQVMQEHYGDAYLQTERARALVEGDQDLALIYYYRAISLENINEVSLAVRDWRALLALPEEAVSPQMRVEAQQHLGGLRPPQATATPTATKKPTPTVTLTATKQPTATIQSTVTP